GVVAGAAAVFGGFDDVLEVYGAGYRGAEAGVAADQSGAGGGGEGAAADPVDEREAAAGARSAEVDRLGSGDEHRAERFDLDGGDAESVAALSGAVRDRLQRLELLLVRDSGPRLRADPVRDGPAGADQLRQPPDQQRQPAGRHGTGERLPARRPALAATDRHLRRGVRARPRVRRRGRQPRQRRLRGRTTRLPAEA